ncbi:MAG TPA: hypothetical protein VGG25_01270 [Streptosporangiaceae bacterium]|jgi:hypothetical protein
MTTSDDFGQGSQPGQFGGQPPYGQPPGQPGYGPQGGVERQRNGFAIASLVCAIAQVLLFILPLLALLAIIFGAIGISKARNMAGVGRGMSLTGLILGCLGMVLFVVGVVGAVVVDH